MSARGHNETPFRLDALAVDARRGLERVAAGEDETLEGWLSYGAALNEGRALFPGDREFGQWLSSSNLDKHNGRDVHPGDQQAAMWAAANAEQFAEARAAGKARTIRGIHAKWKEIKAERERAEVEAKRKAEAGAKAAQADDNDEIGAAMAATTAPDPIHETLEDFKADKAGISVAGATDGPAPTPDPWRKGISGLTREGLEDEVAGLREENAELRADLDKAKREIERLTTANAELSASNQGAVISRLQKQVHAADYKRDEAMRAAKRMEYRMKQAQKEAEIPL
jgi:chemotaxis protein histidine kinase CheA